MSTHASYRLAGERGGTRGAGGNPGAELPGGLEPEGELQECPDHKPSTFEKGKPRSILSLPIIANLIDIL